MTDGAAGPLIDAAVAVVVVVVVLQSFHFVEMTIVCSFFFLFSFPDEEQKSCQFGDDCL